MSERLPYVISADAEYLVSQWCKRNGLNAPDAGFFNDFERGLVENIAAAGSDFEAVVLPHDELERNMQSLILNSGRGDIIALDRAYVGDNFARHFEVTRAVDSNLNSIGTRPRPHAPSIDVQLDYIIANSGKELTLVDDVIFSGDAIAEAVEMFEKRGARVSTVLAAIAIGEGRKKIEDMGVDVASVIEYEEVKDEICERDFMAGIPFSGRTVYRDDGLHYSAPYFAPFGNPESWASIDNPEAARKLSLYCIERSMEMWSFIEKMNDIKVAHRDIPRPLSHEPGSENFVEYLAYFSR